MRAVLYTEDFEPITVVDLNPTMVRLLDEHGTVRLSISEPISFETYTLDAPIHTQMRIVELRAERLRRHGREHLMLFTYQDENALLLKAAFLPGQTKAVNEVKAAAFAKGFLHALESC